MTRIKICGITHLTDALTAVDAGADALGFVFVPDTPRFVKSDQVAAIIAELPPFITTVGVFASRNAEIIKTTLDQCRLDTVQIHADVTPEFCRNLDKKVIKVVRVKDESSLSILSNYDVNAFLLDTYVEGDDGGERGKCSTGISRCKLKITVESSSRAGLNPDNVAQAVRHVKPYGVDVGSGVELRPGHKDPDKVRKFIDAVKSVEV